MKTQSPMARQIKTFRTRNSFSKLGFSVGVGAIALISYKKVRPQKLTRSVRRAFLIAAVAAFLVGTAIGCPTADFPTLILGLAMAFIPFVILVTLAIRIGRKRGILLALCRSILLGAVIGRTAGFLSVSTFRFGSYLTL